MTTSTLIGYKALSDLVSKLSFFVTVVLAARILSRDDFGIFALATTTGWILSVVSDFGIQLHVARAVAQRPSRIAAIVGATLRFRLGLAAAAWFTVMPLVLAYLSPADAAAFLLIVLAQLVAALIEFLNYAYRGLSRSDLESSLNLGHRLMVLVAAVLLLPAVPRLGTVAGVLLLPAAATLACSLAVVARVSPQPEPDAPPDLDLVPTFGPLVRAVFPIGLGIVLSALYFRLDLLFVAYWNGTQGAALYNAVFRLVEALRLFPSAVLAVTFPALCRARNLRPLLRVSAGLGALAVLLASSIYSLAPRVVSMFYGDGYLGAVPAFRVLLVAVPLLFVNYALTHQLIGWDGQRQYAWLCGGALIVNVSLNGVLIPRSGIAGAAWATLFTELFLTAGCVVALRATAVARVSGLTLQTAS